jgi:hypothetical protein
MLEGRGDRVPGARSDLCVCLDCCFAVFAGLCGERVLVYKYCEQTPKVLLSPQPSPSHVRTLSRHLWRGIALCQ